MTDVRSKAGKRAEATSAAAPQIVLVRPQIGENIGTAARAMFNCGLAGLRLVAPREPWPNAKAEAAAAGAAPMLARARLFADTAEAVADLTRVYAASARPRDLVKPVLTPRAAAEEMRTAIADGARVGLLFGPERAGLDNDDVTRADAVIEIPANPEFPSLNLAQAVLVCAYEWRMGALGEKGPARRFGRRRARAASKRDMEALFAHLEAELDAAGFLAPPEKRPRMVRNIRNMLARADLTEQEVRTLRGIIAALVKGRGSRD